MKIKYLLLAGCLLLPSQFVRAGQTNSSAAAERPAGGDSFAGKVVETTNSFGYTYVLVDTGGKQRWAVTTEFPVKVGDGVTVAGGLTTDYHSKTLNRDFTGIVFADRITVNGGGAGTMPALPPGHPPLTGGATPELPPGHPSLTSPVAAQNLTDIKKAEGGKTIAEIYDAKARLAGQEVSVRGKVVKYNAMIMGKNWLHIRDGSGTAGKGDNDLTVTTKTPATLGATVLVTGLVSTNRDFGAGYKYSIILEDAKVTVE